MMSGNTDLCSAYKLKRLEFSGRYTPIVLQNENGPCPLIAIANILLLRGKMEFPGGIVEIEQDRLIQMIAGYLLDSNATAVETADAANRQQNINDAIAVLPKLTTGIDVNIKFNSCKGFEFTDEVAIFDLLAISLVHGWLVDPQDSAAPVLQNKSYNEVMNLLVAALSETDSPQMLLSPATSRHLSRMLSSSASGEVGAAFTQRSLDALSAPSTSAGPVQQSAESAHIDELHQAILLSLQSPASVHAAEAVEAEGAPEPALALSSPWEHACEPQAGHVAVRLSFRGEQGGDGDDGAAPVEVQLVAQEAAPKPAAARLPEAGPSSAAGQRHRRSTMEADAGTSGASTSAAAMAAAAEQRGELAQRAMVFQEFLESSPSQLTFAGLAALHQELQEGELAVFFRNNHFNTLYKHSDRHLYILITDQGYLGVSGLAWERLDQIDGDSVFYAADFSTYEAWKAKEQAETAAVIAQIQEQDRQLAAQGRPAAASKSPDPVLRPTWPPPGAGAGAGPTALNAVTGLLPDGFLQLPSEPKPQPPQRLAPPAPKPSSAPIAHTHIPPPAAPARPQGRPAAAPADSAQGDADFMLAVQLQRQEQEAAAQPRPQQATHQQLQPQPPATTRTGAAAQPQGHGLQGMQEPGGRRGRNQTKKPGKDPCSIM